jgi:hypothetical protein
MRSVLYFTVSLYLLLSVRGAWGEPSSPQRSGVEVGARVTVLDIPSLDERDGSFQVVGLLGLQWHDARARAGTWVEDAAVRELSRIWHPDLEIDNEREPRKVENQVLIVRPDGAVRWQERFSARLAAEYDLHSLPFDRQTLPIVLQTFVPGADDEAAGETRPPPSGGDGAEGSIRLVPLDGSVLRHGLQLAEWKVDGLEVLPHSVRRAASDHYSELVCNIAISRRPAFYFYAVVVPSLLVVLVSFSTLWFDPRQFNAIIGPGVSCMLVLIALNFTVSSYLPRVSYVTTLNRFSLQCYVFVFAGIVLNAYLHTIGEGERTIRLRRAARLLLPLAFLLANVAIYLVA